MNKTLTQSFENFQNAKVLPFRQYTKTAYARSLCASASLRESKKQKSSKMFNLYQPPKPKKSESTPKRALQCSFNLNRFSTKKQMHINHFSTTLQLQTRKKSMENGTFSLRVGASPTHFYNNRSVNCGFTSFHSLWVTENIVVWRW